MEQYDLRVDEFIESAPAYAQPILKHIRTLVHDASPLIMETIKWNCPFFDYKGTLCYMNAFKAHLAFGFWDSGALIDAGKYLKRGAEKESAGTFGAITSLSNLPPDHIIKDFILQAMAANEKGAKSKRPVAVKKSEAEKAALVTPEDFNDLLSNNPKAKAVFDKFGYSHKKEYIVWITEAKTDATRQKRIQQAIEMIGEGKSRHWKYQ